MGCICAGKAYDTSCFQANPSRLAVRRVLRSGHWGGIEQNQRVRQLPVFGPGLLAAAGYVQHKVEKLPAHFFDAGRAICYPARSEEHTSELQSLMRISYAVFCLKKKTSHK